MIVDRSTTRPSAPPAFHSSTDPTARAARIGSIAPSYAGLRSRVRVMMYSGLPSVRARLMRV